MCFVGSVNEFCSWKLPQQSLCLSCVGGQLENDLIERLNEPLLRCKACSPPPLRPTASTPAAHTQTNQQNQVSYCVSTGNLTWWGEQQLFKGPARVGSSFPTGAILPKPDRIYPPSDSSGNLGRLVAMQLLHDLNPQQGN